jgi:phosphatidylserine/phosphatidylglycerophosphate/cardiolipin synthase-like enzyme
VTVHASPENSGTDLVLARLSGMSSGSGCAVGVSQAMWTARGYANDTSVNGEAVAKRLAALKAGGCAIGVIVGNKDGTTTANIDSGPRAILTNAGIPIEHGKVHDKYFFMNGGGKPPTVVTGSHNFSLPAWKHNDEVLVELSNSQSTYDAYYNHWWTTLSATVP